MRTTAVIYKANCYFRVTDFKEEFYKKVIQPFCRTNLFKYGQETDPATFKKYWKVTHVFARGNNDQTEYRLPHSMIDKFIDFAVSQGYKKSRIIINDEPVISGEAVELKMKHGFETPRENQHEWIDYQLREGGLKANNASTGLGKASMHSSLIKIPNGWKRFGTLKVDDVITSPNGKTTKVTGVFPQGVSDVYKITFGDGRVGYSTLEHLWKIYDVNKPLSTLFGLDKQHRTKEEIEENRWNVVPLSEIIELLKNNVRKDKLYIPLPKSEDGQDLNLNLDPYELGSRMNNRELELDCERVIPSEYLLGSHNQRSALVRGILDGDGVECGGSVVTFTTEHRKLASSVSYLIKSLGGLSRVNKFPIGNTAQYRVYISHPTPNDLFLSRFSDGEANTLKDNPDLKLRIIKVEYSHQEETSCISVENEDRLYVLDNFVVTHNTYMALYTATKLSVRTVITIQPRYITTWLNDIAKTLDVDKEDVLVWELTDLELLAKNIESGKINPKIIILPLTRMVTYIKNMRKGETPCIGEILDRINAGYRIIDEAHESFHEVCTSMFFGNPAKTLMLSATLQSDDQVINNMYKHMMPIKMRLKEPDPEHYIDVKAYKYRICPRRYKYKTVQFGSYSDIAYEGSIYKSEVLTNFYYELMKKLFIENYLNVREEGTKCLFFFTLIKLCRRMLELFRRDFPDLDFETFLGSLDKKNPTKYLEHEIIITTPGSCGTGKDIPGLVTVISPHTVFSTQRNKQMIGRLRDPKDKFQGRITPTFVFPVNSDIGKHRECYEKRKVAFEAKQKSFRLLDSNVELI